MSESETSTDKTIAAKTENGKKKKNPWKTKEPNPSKNKLKKVKSEFKGTTQGLEEDFFFYGKGMNVKCLTSREAFLNWVGMKYSASEKVSLDTRTFTIIGVKMPKDYKDDTEFKALRYTTQKQWEAQLKQYNNIKGKDLTNLSSCFSVLWEQLSCRTTRYVHKCTGLTRHIRHSQECSAYYSSLGLTWNRDINI